MPGHREAATELLDQEEEVRMIAHGGSVTISGCAACEMTGDPRFIIVIDGRPYMVSTMGPATGDPEHNHGPSTVVLVVDEAEPINRSYVIEKPYDWQKMLELYDVVLDHPPVKTFPRRLKRKKVPKRPRPKNIKPRCQIRAGQYRLFR